VVVCVWCVGGYMCVCVVCVCGVCVWCVCVVCVCGVCVWLCVLHFFLQKRGASIS